VRVTEIYNLTGEMFIREAVAATSLTAEPITLTITRLHFQINQDPQPGLCG
jgi:hypothetical protein